MLVAANVCTGLRVLLAPVFAWAVVRAHGEPSLLPLAIYTLAAVTDFVDGRLARAAGAASTRGRLFDHGADACFLFPALFVLATFGRVPFALPVAATIAFSAYLREGWRHGRRDAAIALQPSQFGAVGGILNYVIAGIAAVALALGPTPLDTPLYVAAVLAAGANLVAIAERVRGLLCTVGGGRTLTSRMGRP